MWKGGGKAKAGRQQGKRQVSPKANTLALLLGEASVVSHGKDQHRRHKAGNKEERQEDMGEGKK